MSLGSPAIFPMPTVRKYMPWPLAWKSNVQLQLKDRLNHTFPFGQVINQSTTTTTKKKHLLCGALVADCYEYLANLSNFFPLLTCVALNYVPTNHQSLCHVASSECPWLCHEGVHIMEPEI